MRASRYLLVVGVWLVAGYASLWIAATTKIGPVVASLSRNHGVHTGDVVAVVAGAAVASLVTLALLGPSSRARSRT